MDQRTRVVAGTGLIVLIFLTIQLGSLALVEPFKAAGLQPDVDHQDPTNSLAYIAAILVATVLMLGAMKLDVQEFIRLAVVGSGGYIAMIVFRTVVPPAVTVGGFHALAWLGGAALAVALWQYPEWYVIDAAGILMGIGAVGLFGITFGVFPALVLLTVLGVYDAISVYGTEHMLTLASGVMEMRLPIVLVVPLSLDYSFLDAEMPTDDDGSDSDTGAKRSDSDSATDTPNRSQAEDGDPDDVIDADPTEREALFIGLGDAVIPSVLVASAGFFAPASAPGLGVPGLALTLPAVGAMIGTTVGLLILLWMVLKGRAHAGLPLLNGCAIAGYVGAALLSGLSLLEALGVSGFL